MFRQINRIIPQRSFRRQAVIADGGEPLDEFCSIGLKATSDELIGLSFESQGGFQVFHGTPPPLREIGAVAAKEDPPELSVIPQKE